MRRYGMLAVVVGLGFAVACSNNGNSRGMSSGSTSAASDNPSIKLTGCLTQGSNPGTFILENARYSSTSSPSGAAGSTGSSGTTGAAGATSGAVGGASSLGTQYVLVAADSKVDLGKQLNHEVEVNGRADTSTPPASSSSSSSAATTPSAQQRLIVNSVSSVSDRCTAPPSTR